MIQQTMKLEKVLSRNLCLAGKVNVPKKVYIKDVITTLPPPDISVDGCFTRISLYEILSCYMLNFLQLYNGTEERSLISVLHDPQTKSDKIYQTLRGLLEENLCSYRMILGLSLVQSKRTPGIIGQTFYGDFKGFGVKEVDLYRGALDIAFGKDEVGKAVDELLSGTRCPNLIDVCDLNDLKALLDIMRKSSIKFSSMTNYFACRGMTYLNQEPFVKVGFVCGKVEPSFVKRVPQVHSLADRNEYQTVSTAPDWDMAILNGKQNMLLFLSPLQFERYVKEVKRADLSAATVGGFGGVLFTLEDI